MSEQAVTLRQQADAVAIIGANQEGWAKNLRSNPKRQAEAAMIESRLDELRAAWKTLDELAKKEEANG